MKLLKSMILIIFLVMAMAGCGRAVHNLSTSHQPENVVPVPPDDNCSSLVRNYSWVSGSAPNANLVFDGNCNIVENGTIVGTIWQHEVDYLFLNFVSSGSFPAGSYQCHYLLAQNTFTCPGIDGTFNPTPLPNPPYPQ